MQWLLYPFAVLAGISNPIQSGSNSGMYKALGQPILAGLLVYVVGVVTLFASGLFFGMSLSGLGERWHQLPWWVWLGGICNAVFILATLLVAKQVGAGTFTTLTLTAAVITSIILDHFGLLGFEVHSVTWVRALGALIMIGGMTMVARG